jgi:hypothetical protein
MVITVLAEPRTGSNNLAKWFLHNNNFTVLFEPFNDTSKHNVNYKFGVSPKLWEYNTKHFFIKEIYNRRYTQFDELIEISDKIIVLYREDTTTQMESWENAYITGNWDKPWLYKKPSELPDDVLYGFYDLKQYLKEDLIDSGKYFTISYEELYYKNGFQRIVDYIDLPEVQNIDFPYGKKYRIDTTINRLI